MSRQTKRRPGRHLLRNTRHSILNSTNLKSIGPKQLAYYGEGISYLEDKEMKGRLIVIEGPDSSGRDAQITMITSKLEARWSCCIKYWSQAIRAHRSRNT